METDSFLKVLTSLIKRNRKNSNTYLHTGWSDQVTEFGSKARMRQTNHFYFSEPPRSFLLSTIRQRQGKLMISHGKQYWVVRNGLIFPHNIS